MTSTHAAIEQNESPPKSLPPVSVLLAEFIAKTRFDNIPTHVLDLAKGRILDAVATAIAARTLAVPNVAKAFAGKTSGLATVIGSRLPVQAIDAAFINATLINGCTHDDFLEKSHAGAVVIPAALALAEEQGASGAELLTAVVVGYELVARAYLGGPGMLPRFRATGVAGSFGAAAAAAKLMDLSIDQTAHALGLAAMFSSGFGEGFLTGTMDVKLNVGWASRSGVSAAQLARCGATAAPLAFEGQSGFYKAFSNSTDLAQKAIQGLGERFAIEDTVYKERPMCIFVQTPVELARSLSLKYVLSEQLIDRVRIRAPVATLTNPGYQNVAPFSTALQARISARFTIAAAILGRPVETYKYFDQVHDVGVLELASRIELMEPGDDASVWVEVHSQGKAYEASANEMDHLRPSLEKTITKFERLTADLPSDRAVLLLKTILNLDRLPSIASLSSQLRAV